MFAFAVWDARKHTLVLARDRLGIKPVYWAVDGQRLVFASELKSLFAGSYLPRRLDAEALHDYLTLLVPWAPRTLFAGVRALEPGALLTVHNGLYTPRRYWTPELRPDCGLDEAHALDAFEARLQETLRDQIVADVPVGAFLSGGIDSSLLVAHLAPARREPLDTFTVGFDDARVDEAPFARVVAERFGTRHHELRARFTDGGCALVERVLDQFDQPFGDSSAIPTWLVAQKTREHVKTVLSGDGGDELFGGYTIYRTAAQLGRLRRWPERARRGLAVASWAAAFAGQAETARKLDKALALAGLSAGEALCALRTYFDEPAKRYLYRPEHAERVAGLRTADCFADELARARAGAADLPSALAACDLRHRLAGDMLCKVDMMSMSHGLEVRVPLLDERIVDLALRLPPSLRLRGGVTKYLLRRAARRRLPAAIAMKPEGGFDIPLRAPAGVDLGPLVSDTLEARSPRLGDIFDWRALLDYAGAFRAGRPPDGVSRWQLDQRVYALVALERWMRRWDVSP